MEDLIPFNPDIIGSGTNNLPFFCGWMPGKHHTNGKKIIIRINGEYYEKTIKTKIGENLVDEQFYFEIEGIEIFAIPSLLTVSF